ncbi:cell wall hydrolase [Phenylobacterium sp.]|uniref:cell wall hydrolase n=1 Tax=Phenylobacterium sp. TaxID=1871053 RepID=UPI0025D12AC0|nr:cell wall hydrolase [Phenylobacterium sp.]
MVSKDRHDRTRWGLRGAAPALALLLTLVFALPAAAQEAAPQLALPSFDPLATSGDAGAGGVAPFVLEAGGETRARAVRCLTQAIYYEAGREPRAGQQAVAQVVLNRMRHPAFPKSVCGVVFEGAERVTGCQFTFTCDGSLAAAPAAARWDAAERVAIEALSGAVADGVGAATHYHAAWMTPYWSPSLVETARIGGHVFYRMPGARGDPAALGGRYSGDEPAPPPPAVTAVANREAAGARSRRRAAPPNPGVGSFSVWGLQVATVTARQGEVTVHSGS